jgi:hypothetical protein
MFATIIAATTTETKIQKATKIPQTKKQPCKVRLKNDARN